MNKTIFIFFIAAIYCCNTKADTPGKAVMHESKISFQAVKDVPGYTFYWVLERGGKGDRIISDTFFYMAASQGAPYSYLFWGVNDINQRSTDTIHFSNYYSPDYVIILKKVREDSIYYTKKQLSNANDIVSDNTDGITNKQLIADANAAKRRHFIKIGLFVLAGLAALGGLIWFFVRRKKKKTIA